MDGIGLRWHPKKLHFGWLEAANTITITFTIGSNQNAKEHKVFVVPDQGKFGVEWTLAHTYPDFTKKVLPCFTTA